MYKWPQGRVIRIICLVLTALITFDLAYNGAYGPLAFALDPLSPVDKTTSQLVIGIFFCVLALAAFLAGLILIGFRPKTVDFLIEVEQEMVRVEWPTMNVLIRSTLIIAVAIVVLAVLILGVDSVNLQFLKLVRWLGGMLPWQS
jgi:preprotein translocase SecE subunit